MFVVSLTYVAELVEVDKCIDKILNEDPFSKAQIALYEVMEFSPSMAGKGFESLLEN